MKSCYQVQNASVEIGYPVQNVSVKNGSPVHNVSVKICYPVQNSSVKIGYQVQNLSAENDHHFNNFARTMKENIYLLVSTSDIQYLRHFMTFLFQKLLVVLINNFLFVVLRPICHV